MTLHRNYCSGTRGSRCAGPCRLGAERAIDKQVVVNATLDRPGTPGPHARASSPSWPRREDRATRRARLSTRMGRLEQRGRNVSWRCSRRRCSPSTGTPRPASRGTEQRSFVGVRFEPLDDRQTRVTLHHTGWGDGGEWDKADAYFDRAWGNVLANLGKRVTAARRTRGRVAGAAEGHARRPLQPATARADRPRSERWLRTRMDCMTRLFLGSSPALRSTAVDAAVRHPAAISQQGQVRDAQQRRRWAPRVGPLEAPSA